MNCTARDMTNGFFPASFVALFEILKCSLWSVSAAGKKERKKERKNEIKEDRVAQFRVAWRCLGTSLTHPVSISDVG